VSVRPRHYDDIFNFCFLVFYKVSSVATKYPRLNITHRSFASGREADEFVHMFGSHKAVKPEVLVRWEQVN